MKKVLNGVTFVFMLVVICISTALAADSLGYSLVAVPVTTSVSDYVEATNNYAFVVNQIYTSSGNLTVRSSIQTSYDGKGYTIGSYFTNDSGETAKNSYYPDNNTNWPSGTTQYKKCSGNNTSSNYCIIKGSEYRVIYNNKNVLNTLRVQGKFTFSN